MPAFLVFFFFPMSLPFLKSNELWWTSDIRTFYFTKHLKIFFKYSLFRYRLEEGRRRDRGLISGACIDEFVRCDDSILTTEGKDGGKGTEVSHDHYGRGE